MEALMEEVVEPSNKNVEIDLVQTMDEILRSGKYLFVFCQEN